MLEPVNEDKTETNVFCCNLPAAWTARVSVCVIIYIEDILTAFIFVFFNRMYSNSCHTLTWNAADQRQEIPMCIGGESLVEVRVEKDLISSWLTVDSDDEENKRCY